MAISFQLLRSSTASKRPTASNLAAGELGLNFNDDTSGLFFENASGDIMKVGPAEVSATAPNASPATGGSTGNSKGELWFDTNNSQLKVYNGSSFVASSATVAGIDSSANATAITIDSSENVTFEQNVTVDGNITLTDNTATALKIIEAGNTYVQISTEDSGPYIKLNRIVDFSHGTIQTSVATDLDVLDNSGTAFRIMEGSNEYVRIRTTDGSEEIDCTKSVRMDGGCVINNNFSITGDRDCTLDSGTSNALDFVISGGNRMMRFNTNTETVLMEQNASVGGTFTFDSVGLTAVQTSAESFADNDTSLMTSAAIDDRIGAVAPTESSGTSTLTFRGFSSEPDPKLTVTAYYVKVGKMVTITFSTTQNFGSYSGTATVTGLPFAANSNTEFFGIAHHNGALSTAANDGVVSRIRPGANTTIDFLPQESDLQMAWSGTSASKDLAVTITYFTA